MKNEIETTAFKGLSDAILNTPPKAPITFSPYSKEQCENDQIKFATALGCDLEKKISGIDYLIIFLKIIEEQGVVFSDEQWERSVQVAGAMKANNSALRQWLYERPEAIAKVSNKVLKYLRR